MKFTLEIEMNSSVAMRTRVDIESALQDTARQFHVDGLPIAGERGDVRAINGNAVGKWEVVS